MSPDRDEFLEELDHQREQRMHDEARQDRLEDYTPAAALPTPAPPKDADAST